MFLTTEMMCRVTTCLRSARWKTERECCCDGLGPQRGRRTVPGGLRAGSPRGRSRGWVVRFRLPGPSGLSGGLGRVPQRRPLGNSLCHCARLRHTAALVGSHPACGKQAGPRTKAGLGASTRGPRPPVFPRGPRPPVFPLRKHLMISWSPQLSYQVPRTEVRQVAIGK